MVRRRLRMEWRKTNRLDSLSWIFALTVTLAETGHVLSAGRGSILCELKFFCRHFEFALLLVDLSQRLVCNLVMRRDLCGPAQKGRRFFELFRPGKPVVLTFEKHGLTPQQFSTLKEQFIRLCRLALRKTEDRQANPDQRLPAIEGHGLFPGSAGVGGFSALIESAA